MTTKFNQELYAQIKVKKNEPLSSIDQRRVRVVMKEKEKEVTEKASSILAPVKGQAVFPAISIEEIIPPSKKCQTGDKGKEKIGASIWANTRIALALANEVVTPKEIKDISSVPSHEMVSRHVHKLVQVIFLRLSLLVHKLP